MSQPIRLAEADAAPLASFTGIASQVADWHDTIAINELGPQDRKRYRREIERAARECGWACAADATFHSVSTWLAKRRLAGNRRNPDGSIRRLAGKTYNNLILMLRSFFAYAKKCEWCADNPTDKVEFVSEQDSTDGSRPFTPDQVRAILDYVRSPTADGRRTTDRYYPYLTGATTMLRPSSLRKLTAGMLEVTGPHDTPKGSLRLPRYTVKKATKSRVIPIPAETTRELLAWIAAKRLRPDDLLFESIPDNDQLIADAHACSIPRYTVEGGVGWNSFRKCYADELSEHLMPTVLNALSGHKDIRTTMKHYIRKGAERARGDVEGLLPPRGKNEKYPQRDLTNGSMGGQDVDAGFGTKPVNTSSTDSNLETLRPPVHRGQGQHLSPVAGGASRDWNRPDPASKVTPKGFEPFGGVGVTDGVGEGTRADLVADALESIARLVRGGGA